MTIYDTNVLDMIAIKDNYVHLVITDHLEWTDNQEEDLEHLQLLQAKINKYIAAYESGELFAKKPEIAGKFIAIQIVAKYCPNKMAADFISRVRDFLLQSDCKKLGLDFYWKDYRYRENY